MIHVHKSPGGWLWRKSVHWRVYDCTIGEVHKWRESQQQLSSLVTSGMNYQSQLETIVFWTIKVTLQPIAFSRKKVGPSFMLMDKQRQQQQQQQEQQQQEQQQQEQQQQEQQQQQKKRKKKQQT